VQTQIALCFAAMLDHYQRIVFAFSQRLEHRIREAAVTIVCICDNVSYRRHADLQVNNETLGCWQLRFHDRNND
jgi:hypothetical protein